jgi:hypothetical protein
MEENSFFLSTCSVILSFSRPLLSYSIRLQIVAKEEEEEEKEEITHSIVEYIQRTIPSARQKIKFPLFINKNAFFSLFLSFPPPWLRASIENNIDCFPDQFLLLNLPLNNK